MATKKKRVYEVAREFKISSEALVEIVRALGVQVKSHMSAVDDATVEALHAQFDREKEKIKRADSAKRERRRQVAEAQVAARAQEVSPGEAAPQATPSGLAPAGPAPSPSAPPVAEPRAAGLPTAAPSPAAVKPEAKAEKASRTTPRAAGAKPAAAKSAAAKAAAAKPAAAKPAAAKPAAAKAAAAKPAAAKPAAAKAAAAKPAAAKPAAAKPAAPPPPPAFRPSQSALAPGATPRRTSPGAPVPRAPAGARPARPPARDARVRRGPSTAAPPAASGAVGAPVAGRRRKDSKKTRKVYDQKKIRESVRKTMHVVEGGKKPKHRRRIREEGGVAVEVKHTLKATEYLTLAELASLMEESPTDVIATCLRLGVMATINQRLERDLIVAIADEFGFEVDFITEYGADQIEAQDEEPEHLESRPPVVTVMGHVDHGKTSLLDHIRKANVAAHEFGRITQHIGAYVVTHNGRGITFLDTPGHAAFTSMRARGAHVTDVVVLVVAADDRVMPQTIEAIDHAKAAGVPIVVAINKMDLPGANAEVVRQDLSRHGLLVEEFGGKVVSVPISAKTGLGIDQLLDMILLETDMADLKADRHKPARGVVIESKVEQGRGVVGTVLIERGTLRVGDAFVCGVHSGKVRAMHNEFGSNVSDAGPSFPVEVLGWDGIPQAGDTFTVLREEREAREIAHTRQLLAREQSIQRARPVSLADFRERIEAGAVSTLNLIIKADVDGSLEALSDSLGKLATDEVKIDFIHRGVGNVNESDVLLAAASDAVIVGFHVRTEARASALAHEKGVDINLYKVIYEAVDQVKKAMAGLLKPQEREVILGAAEIRQVFKLPKTVVAGCYVTEGKIERNARARVIRNQESVWDGKLASLKRFKEDVREVASGFECGMALDGYDAIQVHDIIEVYRIEEVARTL